MSWMKRSVQVSIPMAFAVVLGSLFLGYLAYSHEAPTPRSVFDHSEFLLPLQGLMTEKTFDMEFSVGYESYRYRIIFDFVDEDSTFSEQSSGPLVPCLKNGTFFLYEKNELIGESRQDRKDGVRGWSYQDPADPVVFLESGMHFRPGHKYRLELRMPEFTPRCQTFSLQLQVVVVPRPDL